MLVGVEGGHNAHAQDGHGHQAEREPLKVHAADHCRGEIAHVGLQLILDQAAPSHEAWLTGLHLIADLVSVRDDANK